MTSVMYLTNKLYMKGFQWRSRRFVLLEPREADLCLILFKCSNNESNPKDMKTVALVTVMGNRGREIGFSMARLFISINQLL